MGSPDLAIVAVTRTLRDRLQRALDGSGLVGQVRTDKPDKVTDVAGPVINLYLYQTDINPFMRNDDILPVPAAVPGAGGSAGHLVHAHRVPLQLVKAWRVPLRLHYLLSFYGDEQQQEPQRLLAIALAVLNRYPILAAAALRRGAQAALAQRDPAAVPEFGDVHLSIADLTMDDIYRLWSIFKASFALSLGCCAETVMVESVPEATPAWLVDEIELNVGQDPGLRSIRVEVSNASAASLWLDSAAAQAGRWESGRAPADWPVIGARHGRADWCLYTDLPAKRTAESAAESAPESSNDAGAPAADLSAQVTLGADGSRRFVLKFRKPLDGAAVCEIVTNDGTIAAEIDPADPGDHAHTVFFVTFRDVGA